MPGTGTKIDYVGDKFEEADWGFVHNMPKSSKELNERTYGPMAYSMNRRWAEGPERGQPDSLKVDSHAARRSAGQHAGVADHDVAVRHPGRQFQRRPARRFDHERCLANRFDDSRRASCRTVSCESICPTRSCGKIDPGPHFGIRLGVRTTAEKPREGLFAIGTEMKNEPYWPGIWIHFKSETSRGVEKDSAYLTIRSNSRGGDFRSKEIPVEQFGWWTFGMSISGDGQIHYFAKPGIEDLTMDDHITSQFPVRLPRRTTQRVFLQHLQPERRSHLVNALRDRRSRSLRGQFRRVDQFVNRKLEYEKRRAQASAARKQKSTRRRR